MGYSELDLALMDAWWAMRDRVTGPGADEQELARLLRRVGGKTLTRPVRSWALVLRAGDKRIADDNTQGVVEVTTDRIRGWCGRVRIDRPGVSIGEAARLFGVNRTTVSRWATPVGEKSWKQVLDRVEREELADAEEDAVLARCIEKFGPVTRREVRGKLLDLSYTVNRADRKRDEVRVWTASGYGVDPGGEVWPGYWEAVRAGMTAQVPGDFRQVLTRVDRRLSARTRVWQWVCPVDRGGCGALVYKVYYALPVWTLVRALGGLGFAGGENGGGGGRGGGCGVGSGGGRGAEAPAAGGFVCLKCAGLLYESSERGSVPGVRKDGSRRSVDVWDRFVKRVSAGVLTGKEVRAQG